MEINPLSSKSMMTVPLDWLSQCLKAIMVSIVQNHKRDLLKLWMNESVMLKWKFLLE